MAGPLVSRSGAPISAAMIIASVVLPSPGGPDSSTWSGARPRRRAASSTRPSCSRTRSWPMTSSRLRGPQRRLDAPARRRRPRRRPATAGSRRRPSRPPSSCGLVARSRLAQRPQGGAQQRGDVGRHRSTGVRVGRDRVDGLVGLLGRPAQADQARRAPGRARRPRRHAPRAGRRRPPTGAPIRSLSSSTIRCAPFWPMPGHLGQRRDVLGRDRAAQLVGAVHRQHRLRQLGPDAAGGLQQLEDGAARRRRAKPNSVSESSRTTMLVGSVAGSPIRSVARVRGRALTSSRPTPPTSTTRRVERRRRRPCR